ncbi:MAG: exodeoxyribonuclease V subunit alpha [Acidobacteria bacterium]|nr:exodeoxyribonuclease V subunit alpha [Acidobacteriota bacterium]
MAGTPPPQAFRPAPGRREAPDPGPAAPAPPMDPDGQNAAATVPGSPPGAVPRPGEGPATAPSDLDTHLARFLGRLAGEAAGTRLERVVERLSSRLRDGHVCLDLSDAEAMADLPEAGDAVRWAGFLENLPVVGGPGDHRPLILSPPRLYFHRFWRCERLAADRLRELASRGGQPFPGEIRPDFDALFPPPVGPGAEPDRQRLAAFAALTRPLVVVSGGPGTGKTTTLARLLYLLFRLEPSLVVRLAAPSGKAANRIQEAVREAADHIERTLGERARPEPLARLRDLQGATLHRLLGIDPGTGLAKRHARSPLDCGLVAVDEASMMDLCTLAALLDALPAGARLALLGDRDQLASVEAGAVLAEIAAGLEPGGDRPGKPGTAGREPGGPPAPGPLSPGSEGLAAGSLVVLRRSHRFHEDSGIGRLARAVNAGAGRDELGEVLAHPDVTPMVNWRPLPPPGGLEAALADVVLDGYAACLGERRIDDALAVLSRFRLLGAVREGPFGVLALNGLVEGILRKAGRLVPSEGHYDNRLVMVTENSYAMRLFNGDIGLVRRGPGGTFRVYFPAPGEAGRTDCLSGEADGTGCRPVVPALLPGHETAFALTVHKSQGSEFDHVLLVLPDRAGPVLTRELVYTGITRARKRVTLLADLDVLATAVSRRVRRAMGLADNLRS